MDIQIKSKKSVEVKTLHVNAGVRYWEDATVNGVEDELGDLIPCRNGDRWQPVIDIETGKIRNWKQGVSATIHYKVCDDGIYTLKNGKERTVVEIDDYVPKTMSPKENGYGDYIIMDVSEDGIIAGWRFIPEDFNEEED